MSTPALHLTTCLVLDDRRRILSTREPDPGPGSLFSLVRSATACAWAVRADVPDDLADELGALAAEEPPSADLRAPPLHARRYLSLLRPHITPGETPPTKVQQTDGPAFEFPPTVAAPDGIVVIDDEAPLQHHFRGWIPGEIAAGRAPVMAIIEDGHPVSICFCARLSDVAAEAGLDTAAGYRGRGYGPRVTAAWALAIRASGRTPLYSTAWTNTASLAVARKLDLHPYASSWGISA